MNVVHLSTSDIEGAGRATYRLHKGLQNLGITSQILTQTKFSDDATVLCAQTKLEKLSNMLKLPQRLDAIPVKHAARNLDAPFSTQWVPDGVRHKVSPLNADIVHLHWICQGYLQIETLAKFNKPLVWTLHDMWPFTGGCHYSESCDRYKQSCGTCPQLCSDKDRDLSRWVWQRKTKAWKSLNLAIVAPSIWLAECAKVSSLFNGLRVEVIPHGLDIQQYRPIDKQVARNLLNLPQDKQLILFGALRATSDLRKGFHLLQPALKKLSASGWAKTIELVVFGSSKAKDSTDLGFKSHYLGYLQSDLLLSLVYSAADVMVVPSTQEAFGQTAFEALACGTPVVSFDSTGLRDIVEHQRNGYRAKCFSVEDLAQGIAWVLADNHRWQSLSQRARQKAEQEFALDIQAKAYLKLYQEMLN